MTEIERKNIRQLMVLANAAAELEFVDVELVSQFHYLREQHGLAKLLLLIKEYVKTQTQTSQISITTSPPPTPD